MYVAPQQEAVRRLMLATISVGPYVRRFQCRQCPFTSYCTATPIDIRDEDSEGSLAQPRPDQMRFPISQGRTSLRLGRLPTLSIANCLPKLPTFGFVGTVRLECHDVRRPVFR